MFPTPPERFWFPRHSHELRSSTWWPGAEGIVKLRQGDLLSAVPGDTPALQVHSAADMADLARLKKLRSIDYYGAGFTDEMLALLPSLPELAWLRIWNRRQELTPAGMAALAACPGLRWLAVDCDFDRDEQWLTNKHVGALADMPAIEVLLLHKHRNLKGPGIKALAGLSTLRMLSLSGGKVGKGIGALAGLPKLEALVVDAFESPSYYGNTPITENALAEIGTFTNLRTLSLRYCQKLKALAGLSGLKNLEVLDMEGCNKLNTDDALGPLAGLPRLQILDLDGVSCTMRQGLVPLAESESLKALRIDTFHITDQHMAMIEKIRSLRYLSLEGHGSNSTANLTPDGVAHLGHLERLDLKYTEKSRGCGVVMSRSLMEALAALPLKSLRMYTVDDKATPALFEPLAKSETLQRIHIEGATGIEGLKDALPDCNITTDLSGWEQLEVIMPLARWTAG